MDERYTALTRNSYQTWWSYHAEVNGTKTLAMCTSPEKERMVIIWLFGCAYTDHELITWMNTAGSAPISPSWSRGPASPDTVGPDMIHVRSGLRWATHLGLAAPCHALPSSLQRVLAGTCPAPPTAPAAHRTVRGGLQPASPKPRMLIIAAKLVLPHKDLLWARMVLDNGTQIQGDKALPTGSS